MQSEFSDGKKRREDENPQTLVSPEHEHGTEKKKKRKRKKKSEESNEHPEAEVEVEVCPKPLVDSVIPIVPLGEKAETTADNSNPTPKRKKKNKNLKDADQLLTSDRMEPDVTKEVGSLKGHAYGNEGLCPKPLLDTPTPIVPQDENAEATAENSNPTPKKKKKKVQGVEQVRTSDPSVVIGVKPDVTKKEGAQEGSETAETTTRNPAPIPKKKKKMDVQGAQQQLQTCDPSITTVVEPDVSEEEAAKQGVANGNAVPGINEERPAPDSVFLEDTRRKKKLTGRKKNVLKPHGAEPEPEPKESDNTEYPLQCSPDSELKIKMRKEVEAHNTELPEISIQKTTCLIEAPPIDPAIPGDPCLAIPICPAISIDPEQEMSKKKKKRKRRRRSERISEGSEPNEHNVKPPETPVQRFVYPTVATSTDLTIPVSAPPIDQGQKTSKKKRERSALISKGEEPNKHDDKLPGNPVQRSIYPIAEPSIEPMIPTSQAAPVEPATRVDPKQTTKKKRQKRRKSAVICEVLESQKDNTDPTAKTPVQNPKKKKKPVQKTEGSTTENSMGRCSPEPAAEIPFRKTYNLRSRGNVEPAAKYPVRRTDSLRVTKSSFKQHGESSLICHACRQLGHSFRQCKRLKCLSMNEEVCFFCGEIGHSLGKCGVSQAGGGRFAKCLLCFEHGHFSYNCFQRCNFVKLGHGISFLHS